MSWGNIPGNIRSSVFKLECVNTTACECSGAVGIYLGFVNGSMTKEVFKNGCNAYFLSQEQFVY